MHTHQHFRGMIHPLKHKIVLHEMWHCTTCRCLVPSTLQQWGLNEAQHPRHDGALDTGHCSGLVVDQDGTEQIHDQLKVGRGGKGEGCAVGERVHE